MDYRFVTARFPLCVQCDPVPNYSAAHQKTVANAAPDHIKCGALFLTFVNKRG